MGTNTRWPVVLVFAGHDPSGGAGVTADTLAIEALGAHATTLITALTDQDSQDVKSLWPVTADKIEAQLHTILADMDIAAVKTGLLGTLEVLELVVRLVQQHQIPLVVDPVLTSGAGTHLTDDDLLRGYRQRLLPLATLATPNSLELRMLAECVDLDQACSLLLREGCQNILLTGSHEPGETIRHRLFPGSSDVVNFDYPRLPGEYHGSGCTLAATCAAGLARGSNLNDLVKYALDYTWQTLKHAHHPGRGQAIPQRILPHDPNS